MLHGVVSDGQGRKMSKSLGNVVDPLHLIQGKSDIEIKLKNAPCIITGASLDTLRSELSESRDKGNISQEEMELSLQVIID